MSGSTDMGIFNIFLRKLLKVFFYLLYNPLAWTYDNVADIVSIGRWKEWILLAVPYLRESPVLELGHGPGHLQVALHGTGKRTFGIDVSRQMVRIAQKRLHKDGYSALLVQGKSEGLPFPSRKFRYIVATFPSEYIMKQETLREIWRVLDDGGELIIVAAAWITGDKILDRIAAWLFRVTGQAPTAEIFEIQDWYSRELEKIQDIKYLIKTQLIELETSKVLLIHANKAIT
jgi:ubiquinone/menaquinone biosynthesis C-methylase UbiE